MLDRLYFFILIFSVIFFQNSGHRAFAQTPENCEQELRQATNLFRSAKYDSALSLLNLCLVQKQPKPSEKAEAYKLLGKVKVALDDATGAKAAFLEMLSLQPFMELDSKQETPETVKIFNEVRIDFLTANPTTKGSKNWPWFAVSGAVVFTVSALLFLK
ncbi:hypothetical protein IIA28_10765 [candidate division KSB1 bacterium]|nr:hypothetical protein [candidate division KSB1 bacterium]